MSALLVTLLVLLAPLPARAGGRLDRGPPVLSGGSRHAHALVIGLHGGSWSRRSPRDLARRLFHDLDREARRAGLALLVPEAPAVGPEHDPTVPWAAPAGEALVLKLVDEAVAAGRADAGRVYLAGHGAGATAALLLAARHPERFAGIALWSGSPSPLWDREGRVVGLVEDPVPRLAGVPVYLWTAKDDPVIDREALGLLVDGLRARAEDDPAYELVWDQGQGGHGFGSKGPRAGLRFLAAHRREREDLSAS